MTPKVGIRQVNDAVVGQPFSQRKYLWMPPGVVDSFRVVLLLRAVQTEGLLGNLPDWEQDTLALLETIANQARRDVISRAREYAAAYLLTQNEAVLPLVVHDLEWLLVRASPVDYASGRLQAIDDARPLFRQTTRKGRETRHRKLDDLQQSVRQKDLIRVDGLSAMRVAEGWVRVRLDLEKSLADFVRTQPVRPWARGTERPPDNDFSVSYKEWWKALRRFDDAKESRVLPPFADPAWTQATVVPSPGARVT